MKEESLELKQNFEQLPPKTRYMQWVEEYLQKIRDTIRVIPEEERRLERIEKIGYRMEIKEPFEHPTHSYTEPKESRYHTVEYFFDFDDTLFDTTGYTRVLWGKLSENLDVDQKTIDEIYESSKTVNKDTEKPMYQEKVFIDALKMRYPSKSDVVDNAFSYVYQNIADFVHVDMAQFMELVTSSPLARVHILTFGDIEVQLKKVEAVIQHFGTPMDVLYTQVPKADFLRHYLPTIYPELQSGSPSNTNTQNFVVIDDSEAEIHQLLELGKELPYFLPLRLRKPEAKKSSVNQRSENPAYEIKDNYGKQLFTAASRLVQARKEGAITREEWLNSDTMTNLGNDLRSNPRFTRAFTTEVREGTQGTVVLSRRFEGDTDKGEIDWVEEEEIGFDSHTNEMYKVQHNEDGSTNTIPYRPYRFEMLMN